MKLKAKDIYGKEHEFDESLFIDRTSVYGILIKDSSLLLVQDIWAHFWYLPGGGIDKNETHQEALYREMLEETGVKINSEITLFDKQDGHFIAPDQQTPWRTHLFYYSVSADNPTIPAKIKSDDTVTVTFAKLSELPSLPLNLVVVPVINKILETY